MGGPFTYYLLKTLGDEWTRTFVKKVIFVAPAFMGSPKAIDAMFNGVECTLPINTDFLGPLARHLPTAWMLFPWATAFGDGNDIFATTPHKVYTFKQINELLKDVGMTDADLMLNETRKMIDKWNEYSEPLPVPVITHLGTGMQTTKSLSFNQDLFHQDPDGKWPHSGHGYCDGDGTVPLVSSSYPTIKWKRMGRDVQTFFHPGAEHLAILKTNEVINNVINEACN